MKRFLLVLIGIVAVVSLAVAAAVQALPARIAKNVFAAGVPLSGLTKEEAARRMRIWWEDERQVPIAVSLPGGKVIGEYSATALGVGLDDVSTVEAAPFESVIGQVVSSSAERIDLPVKFKSIGADFSKLDAIVRTTVGKLGPARVTYDKGEIIRKREVSGLKLDRDRVYEVAITAVLADKSFELPVTEVPKKISDDDLAKITDVTSSFSTNFSAGQRDRSNNIRVAAGAIDGLVLLPGERFSFNKVVGRRTIEAGYKEAGVYANGRHERGLGGGICQVSTTLYNAALFADLKIVQRTNHSMPVPYVPLGRDATVNYGAQDLVFENNTPEPIAISSLYTPGRLTFRILGRKLVDKEIKLVADSHRSWDRGVRTVINSALPAGKKKVVEKGSRGYSCQTYRLVYEGGKLVRRDSLGRSYYAGAVRIVEAGPGFAAAPTNSTQPSAPQTLNSTTTLGNQGY